MWRLMPTISIEKCFRVLKQELMKQCLFSLKFSIKLELQRAKSCRKWIMKTAFLNIEQWNLKLTSDRVFWWSLYKVKWKCSGPMTILILSQNIFLVVVWLSCFVRPKYMYQAESLLNLTFISHTLTSESCAEKMMWRITKKLCLRSV